jgi:class 3 adenylate cyclase/tetratricopeptide (TPR) repeat protein
VRSPDNPQAYLAMDRRRALAQGLTMPDRVRGSGIFVDVSGFTPLTEALAAELGPRQGADRVSAVLGDVFEALLDVVHAWGGDVIYFSGDAVTCWLDGDDGLAAVACAQELQAVMRTAGQITTPAGSLLALGIKVAIAVGPARRFVVGDPAVQLIDVLAGRLVDQLAAAESHATVGQIVLDDSAVQSLGDRIRVQPGGGPGIAVLADLATEVPRPALRPPPPELPEQVVRQWLLPPVFERMRAGQGEFLAELRPAVPLFLSFDGITYDDDEQAPQKLDTFVQEAQRIIDSFGGSTLQLTLGDKGAYLYAVFGSPVAHQDDAARACAAALALTALEGRTAARNLRIGVAHGRLRSGTYGHPERRTFCCLGDAVNLAARLMSAAPPGQVYVSEVVRHGARDRATGTDRLTWHALTPMKVKGKAEPVEVWQLAGHAGRGEGTAGEQEQQRFSQPMIGRERELALLTQTLDDALRGHGQVVRIVAEAGMGKSRLTGEFTRRLQEAGAAVHAGECPAFGAVTSYAAWRDVWWQLLGLANDPAAAQPVEQVIQQLTQRLDRAGAGLAGRLPLLGPLLGLTLPDTELTRGFDAKLRKASLEDLLTVLLADAAQAGPVALVIEDSHWMDPLSGDLLTTLAQHLTSWPVLLLLTTRPADPGQAPAPVTAMAHHTQIELDPLTEEQVRALVSTLAPQSPPVLAQRVAQRAEGNPFYAQELVAYLTAADGDGGQTVRDPSTVDLPESLSTLVLSRVDTLPEGPRRAAKVASVVGRSFTATQLAGVHPDLGETPIVEQQVQHLCTQDLAVLEDPASRLTSFRHVIVRDVAYESLPSELLCTLHERAGDYFSVTLAGAGDQLLDLLAYHYGRGRDEGKKRTALLAAARAAQARYANATALEHYRSALPLVPAAQRGEVLRDLGQVLELTGAWDKAEQSYLQARDLAHASADGPAAGWSALALAEIARKQGRYAEAEQYLDDADAAFGASADEPGAGRSLHLRGTLAAQQGQYAQAREAYQASLAVRERIGDQASAAAVLSNLGVVAEYTGDYELARELNEQALAARIDLGDRWAIGVSQNNLGMVALLLKDLEGARSRFTEAMRLSLEVGDAWLVAIAHNNLANCLRDLGDLDGARAQYAQTLRAYQRWDDRWALATALEDLVLAAIALGRRAEALTLLGAADHLREDLGSPRTPSAEATLSEGLSTSGLTQSVVDRDAQLRAIGQTMTLDQALALALAVCDEDRLH